jgi:hypothetical protein
MTAASKMYKKSLNSPGEVCKFEKGRIEIANLDNVTVGGGTFEPGWSWEKCFKTIAVRLLIHG